MIILKAAGSKKDQVDDGRLEVTGHGPHKSEVRELTESERRKKEHQELFRSQRFKSIDEKPMGRPSDPTQSSRQEPSQYQN